MKTPAQGVRWDLSDLYKSPSDPKLASALKEAASQALRFEKRYKPLLDKIAAGKSARLPVAALLADYKQIVTLLSKLLNYAHLHFAEKTDEPQRGAFLQKVQTEATQIQSRILFWETGFSRLPAAAAAKILKDPKLAADRHYLERLREFGKHTLSEPEEKIMAFKSDTSGSAFSRLFDETINALPFYIEENGKKAQKTEAQILALFHSHDRQTRRKASLSLAAGLSENTRLLTYIYNMILADHRLSLKLRSYKHPSDPRNLANETDRTALMGLVAAVKKSYPMVARYYTLKRRLLGLEEMCDYDRYASIESGEKPVSFEECRKIVLAGYRELSPQAADIAQKFFDRRWIDAEIRQGKQGGGFSCQTTPDLHPYILVNYTGRLRDVLTVAHELGHGIHQYLSRQVGVLECDAPLTMAETASVFGEMLIFEKILSAEKNPSKRLVLICGMIDDQFATVFRQIAMTDFELMAHEAGLKDGELSDKALSDFWIEANRRMYGSSVRLTDEYRHGWKYIPHFVHTPFYCYAYAFAQLFVLSLFEKYKEDPKDFVPRYFKMLSLGGSQKPAEIAKIAGIRLGDPALWERGLKLLERLVVEAETLNQ